MEVRRADGQDDFIGLAFNYQSMQPVLYASNLKREREVYTNHSPFTATAEAELQVKGFRTQKPAGTSLRNSILHSGSLHPLHSGGGLEAGRKRPVWIESALLINKKMHEPSHWRYWHSSRNRIQVWLSLLWREVGPWFGQPNVIWSEISIKWLLGGLIHAFFYVQANNSILNLVI